MHKKDQVKQVIEIYIKKGRDFFELTPSFLGGLSELKGFSERTLKRGRTEFKNENKDVIKKHSKDTVSLRRKINKFLNQAPKPTLPKLKKEFPKIDKEVVSTSFKLWKKEQTPKKEEPKEKKTTVSQPKISAKQKVADFLNKKPSSSLEELIQKFPDIKKASIGTYHSLWKSKFGKSVAKEAKKAKDPVKTIEKVKETAKATEKVKETTKAVKKTEDSNQELISALKKTIDAHQRTIEALKSQNEILLERNSLVFSEMEGMSREKVAKVENAMRIFIKGLQTN